MTSLVFDALGDKYPNPTRYCLHGGPGVGKSAEAASLYHSLKTAGRPVEMVRERIKEMAYRGVVPTKAEKLRFFTDELAEEFAFASLGLNVVSDGPLWSACYYAKNNPFRSAFEIMARQMDEMYPAVHVLLPQRFAYDPTGRYQSESEALGIHEEIRSFLISRSVPFIALRG